MKPPTQPTTDRSRALMAFSLAATIENAAVKAGVGVNTVQRRLSFRNSQEVAGYEIRHGPADRSRTNRGCQRGSKDSARLAEPTTPPAIRLQAARHIIELGVKLRDASELQDRIAALEQQVGGDNTAPAFIPPPHELPGPTLAPTPQEEPAA